MAGIDRDALNARLRQIADNPAWSIPHRFEAKAVADGLLALHVQPRSLSDRDLHDCLDANIHHRPGGSDTRTGRISG